MQRRKDRDANGAYFTPTETILDFLAVQDVLDPCMSVWEPACGSGNISKALISKGYNVFSSDLYNYGYGMTGVDFLKVSKKFDVIITNPPYSLAEQFIERSLEHASIVVMLLRLSFLEGQGRARGLWKHHPPHRVYICGRRPSMYKVNHIGKKNGGFVAYAWYVWKKESTESRLEWIIDTGVKHK